MEPGALEQGDGLEKRQHTVHTPLLPAPFSYCWIPPAETVRSKWTGTETGTGKAQKCDKSFFTTPLTYWKSCKLSQTKLNPTIVPCFFFFDELWTSAKVVLWIITGSLPPLRPLSNAEFYIESLKRDILSFYNWKNDRIWLLLFFFINYYFADHIPHSLKVHKREFSQTDWSVIPQQICAEVNKALQQAKPWALGFTAILIKCFAALWPSCSTSHASRAGILPEIR